MTLLILRSNKGITDLDPLETTENGNNNLLRKPRESLRQHEESSCSWRT